MMEEKVDLNKVEEILSRHGAEKGALIPVLQEVQALFSYLSEEALVMIGKRLKVPLSHIYGVITFYAQFYLTPRGKHVIKSCQGTACHVRGGHTALDALSRELKVKPGETTGDLNFTLETVACLGTCFLAPVLMVDNDYYGKLTPKRAVDALKKYRTKASREEAKEDETTVVD
jgi:NADH:ubiquinone oxidoreductase subunit E